MTLQIQTVGDVAGRGIKVIAYSASGAGKTFAIGSLMHMNPLIISTENGLLSLKKDFPEIHCMVVTTYAEFKQALQWSFSPEYAHYGVICIDGLTDIAEILLAEEKVLRKDARQAYGEMGDGMLHLMYMIRAATKNVYMTAKEGVVLDSDGIQKLGPVMPGKALTPQIPFLFDEVLQLVVSVDPTTQERFRWFRTVGDTQFVAKDRSGMLDIHGERTSLGEVFHKIQGV